MDTNLSRNGRSNPSGKMDVRIDVPMTEDLHDEVLFMAKLHNMTKAEFIRYTLERVIYGELAIAKHRAGIPQYAQGDESRINDRCLSGK